MGKIAGSYGKIVDEKALIEYSEKNIYLYVTFSNMRG